MAKETTHRAEELKELGWSLQDISRYIDLWDYRQRWGAINLEREDRLFLKKIESSLPDIKPSKTSVKKPIKDKSYYRRILFFLSEMRKAEESFDSLPKSQGIWSILLEEELRALDYFQPVLGLPDTLKAKALIPFRENIISMISKKFNDHIEIFDFDFKFELAFKSLDPKLSKNWKPLREGIEESLDAYPVIGSAFVEECRMIVRKESVLFVRDCFPSLLDLDKPNPADDWIP